MKKTAFQGLLTSVREAGRIRRGTLKPSRTTVFPPGRRQRHQAGRGLTLRECAPRIIKRAVTG